MSHQGIMNHTTENREGTQQETPNTTEQNLGLQFLSQGSQKQHVETNYEQGCSRPFKRI